MMHGLTNLKIGHYSLALQKSVAFLTSYKLAVKLKYEVVSVHNVAYAVNMYG